MKVALEPFERGYTIRD